MRVCVDTLLMLSLGVARRLPQIQVKAQAIKSTSPDPPLCHVPAVQQIPRMADSKREICSFLISKLRSEIRVARWVFDGDDTWLCSDGHSLTISLIGKCGWVDTHVVTTLPVAFCVAAVSP
jgi:hypothetical protein